MTQPDFTIDVNRERGRIDLVFTRLIENAIAVLDERPGGNVQVRLLNWKSRPVRITFTHELETQGAGL